MAYLHQQQPSNRIAAIMAVGALHLAAFYAVVTGLTVAFQREADPLPFSATNTPVKPPPAPSQAPRTRHPVAPPIADPARDPLVLPAGLIPLDPPTRFRTDPGPTERIIPEVRPSQPAFTPLAPRPLGRPGEWIGEADYPTSELRLNHTGTVGFRLTVGSDGWVSDCAVTVSSGFAKLDSAACALLVRRARFEPARDEQGQPAPGTFASAVHWQIPG